MAETTATDKALMNLSVLEPYVAKLDFVQRDRYVSGLDYVTAYGWISRPDGRADFVVLDQEEGRDAPIYWTSSARYSAEICRLLYGEETDHIDCQRVEHAGLSLPNVVRLKRCPSCDGNNVNAPCTCC